MKKLNERQLTYLFVAVCTTSEVTLYSAVAVAQIAVRFVVHMLSYLWFPPSIIPHSISINVTVHLTPVYTSQRMLTTTTFVGEENKGLRIHG
mgnify:CR=1 FL=1